jgi:hypothetical protein
MRRAFFLLPILALAGCAATPEQRVRAELVQAGVPPHVAGCMAERMTAKLTIEQLKELKRLGTLAKEEGDREHMTPKHILHKVEALGDPEIVEVTSRAAIGCYIAG